MRRSFAARRATFALRPGTPGDRLPVSSQSVTQALKRESQPRCEDYRVSLSNLIEANALTPPFNLQRDYKGRRVVSKVDREGRVVFQGRPYASLSGAAAAAITHVSKIENPSVDGWTFWKYEAEDGSLKSVHEIRQKFQQLRGATEVRHP